VVEVKNDDGVWAELISGGFIPSCHLKKLNNKLSDHVGVSRFFLNTPYLWGGCSRKGVDCSGLVQTALHSCGISCPRDTDMQEFLVGKRINVQDAKQGDLVFWKGHVGILSKKNTLLHASAFHMSVVEEDFRSAKNRIEESKGGKITTVRRI
jgi:cell wall-associated NlpC family hydrolase